MYGTRPVFGAGVAKEEEEEEDDDDEMDGEAVDAIIVGSPRYLVPI